MKIIVGKTYKTFNGKIVEIIKVDDESKIFYGKSTELLQEPNNNRIPYAPDGFHIVQNIFGVGETDPKDRLNLKEEIK